MTSKAALTGTPSWNGSRGFFLFDVAQESKGVQWVIQLSTATTAVVHLPFASLPETLD